MIHYHPFPESTQYMADEYTARVGKLKKQTHLTEGESRALGKLITKMNASSVSDVIRTVLCQHMRAVGLLS